MSSAQLIKNNFNLIFMLTKSYVNQSGYYKFYNYNLDIH
jgi:hypothetical protein